MVTITTFIYLLLLSTNCVQEFSFIGATYTNTNIPTIWIVENVSGECQYSKLIQISFSDTSSSLIETNFNEYKHTKQFSKSFSEYHQLPITKLDRIDKSFNGYLQYHFSIQEPSIDSLLLSKYIKDGDRKYPLPIQMPIFIGVTAKLLFSYSSGFYINYKIDNTIYVPSHKLLIVFTKNSLIATGGDTMHGFMVFRLYEENIK